MNSNNAVIIEILTNDEDILIDYVGKNHFDCTLSCIIYSKDYKPLRYRYVVGGLSNEDFLIFKLAVPCVNYNE